MLALNVRNKILHKAVNKIRQNSETYPLRPCVLKLFTQTLADFGETFFVN